MRINFDMDGTIANLYGVDNWLDMILGGNPTPYKEAKPMLNLSLLARYLNRLQKQGHEIIIISWLCGGEPTAEFNEAVTIAKIEWLRKHLKSVQFNEIHIVKHGTPKNEISSGILFDDEARNREAWGKGAYPETQIMEILKTLL